MTDMRSPFPGARQALVIVTTVAVAITALVPTDAQAHGKAHQHGVAQLDVVLSGSELTIELDSPLDNLLGFERAPRTAAERDRVQKMVATLREGKELFSLDAAAKCELKAVELHAPKLDIRDTREATASASPTSASPAGGEHADLRARWRYACAASDQLAQVSVGLFAAFSGFRQIDAQVVRENRQSKATLSRARASTRLNLPR